MDERSFLFLIGSTRRGGNTEALAVEAARRLPAGVPQRWLRLDELPLPDFLDVRHSGDGVYPAPTGNGQVLLDATLDATDLVLATPLHWYTMSTITKRYLDHWSGWLRVPGVDFRARMRGRTLWGVSAVSNLDLSLADPLAGTLRLTADYMGMRFGGHLLGYANRPGEMHADADGLTRAKSFFS
ncbi:MAG TPA: NAD(P)H-dependent oxidoreductase [Asanoa sp.]|nr:NAD(P)H-dependent oxidoreductase [Asanoa sp.]